MFNTLAGYLLRNSNTSTNIDSDNLRNEESTGTVNRSLDEHNITTTPTEDDDCDWLLVIENSSNNKSSSDNNLNCDNSVEDENEENDDENGSEYEETQFVDLLNNSNERLQFDECISQSIIPNRPVRNINAMDESWFITPPPCFTSTGPINMETSPLENLLIEHPSMSVYRISRNPNEQVITDDIDDMVVLNFNDSADEIIAVIEESRDPRHQNRSTTRTSSRSNRIQQHLNEQQTKLIILEKKAWKVADKKSRQLNKRNTLERLNNVHHIAHMGRKKRCDMYNANLNSRCNNNRKC